MYSWAGAAGDKVIENGNIHYRDGYQNEYDTVKIDITATGVNNNTNYDKEKFHPNEGTSQYSNCEYGTGVLIWGSGSNLTVNRDLTISVVPEDVEGNKTDTRRQGIQMQLGGKMTVGGDTSILIDNYKHTELSADIGADEDYGLDSQQGIHIWGNDTELTLDGNLDINMFDGNRSIGILAYEEAKLNVGENVEISVKNAPYYTYGISNQYDDQNYGLHANDKTGNLHFKGNLSITTEGGNNSIGINLKDANDHEDNAITVDGHLKIHSSGAKNYEGKTNLQTFPDSVSNYGMYFYQIDHAVFNTADITATSYDNSTGTFTKDAESIGSYTYWFSNTDFRGNASIKAESDDDSTEIAVLSRAGSQVTFEKGLKAEGKVALNASGNTWNDGSSITVNSTEDKTVDVQIDGNIVVGKTDAVMIWGEQYDTSVDTAETKNVVTANLLSNKSYFTGVNEYGNEASEVNLTFANGAKWNMTDSSSVTNLVLENGGKVDMTSENKDASFRELKAKNLSGDGGIVNMNIDASTNTKSDRIFVDGTHSGEQYIQLQNVGATTDGAKGTVLASVQDEQGAFKVSDTEGGLYWNTYTLAEQNSQTDGYTTDWILADINQDEDRPTTSVETIMSANALNYHTWRAETDKLMKRMGDLRHNGPDDAGIWFRISGSKISRDDGVNFENEYVSYELGYDKVVKQTDKATRYQGIALSYTDGDSSYDSGSGENDSKSISFYSTEMRSSGHYLDFVFKLSRMSNDFHVMDTNSNRIDGDYDNNGVSFSAEYGRKKALGTNGWYIEPQGQVTLGYFSGDEYDTNNGIHVDQSGIPSVLGRLGFNIGRDISDKANVYLKANILHEFCGDYDVDMMDASGLTRRESADFDDTWFEYGMGVALKTGDNNHLYFDFEKTAGGDFEKDWSWNAGMRWTF